MSAHYERQTATQSHKIRFRVFNPRQFTRYHRSLHHLSVACDCSIVGNQHNYLFHARAQLNAKKLNSVNYLLHGQLIFSWLSRVCFKIIILKCWQKWQMAIAPAGHENKKMNAGALLTSNGKMRGGRWCGRWEKSECWTTELKRHHKLNFPAEKWQSCSGRQRWDNRACWAERIEQFILE